MFKLGISGPVWGAIASGFATIAGLGVYNMTSRPTTQTVQGIDNATLVVIAAAITLVAFWNR